MGCVQQRGPVDSAIQALAVSDPRVSKYHDYPGHTGGDQTPLGHAHSRHR